MPRAKRIFRSSNIEPQQKRRKLTRGGPPALRKRYDSDAEIEDSFAQSDPLSPEAPVIQVIIEVKDNFPRDDYQRIAPDTPTRKPRNSRSASVEPGDRLPSRKPSEPPRVEIPDSQEETQVRATGYSDSLAPSQNEPLPDHSRRALFSDRVIPDSQGDDRTELSGLATPKRSPTPARGSASQIDSEFASPFGTQPGLPLSPIAKQSSSLEERSPSPEHGKLTLANLELLDASVEVVGGSFPRPVSALSQTPASETSSELLARAHQSGHELLFETAPINDPFIRDNSAPQDEDFDNLVLSQSLTEVGLLLSQASPHNSQSHLLHQSQQFSTQPKDSQQSLNSFAISSYSEVEQNAQIIPDVELSSQDLFSEPAPSQPKVTSAAHAFRRSRARAFKGFNRTVTKSKDHLEDIEEDSVDGGDTSRGHQSRAKSREFANTGEGSAIESFESQIIPSVEGADSIVDQSFEIMDRPSFPSTGMPANNSYSGTPNRGSSRASSSGLSFAERFRRQAQEAEAKAMEGLSTHPEWEAGSEPVDIPYAEEEDSTREETSKLSDEPLASQKLPLREAPHDQSSDRRLPATQPEPDNFISEDIDTAEDDSESHDAMVGKTLPMRALGKAEEVVLLPLVDSIRKMYNHELPRYQVAIRDLFASQAPSAESIASVDKLVRDLNHMCDHNDLVAAPDSQAEEFTDATISQWSQNISPKCLFLVKLFAALKPQSVSLAILAEPGLALDILSSICKDQRVRYERPDKDVNEFFPGGLSVTLLPTGFDGDEFVVSAADAVIAFDSSYFRGEVYTKNLREHVTNPRILAPLIHLVTVNAPEHVDLCLPKIFDPITHRRHLITIFTQKRLVVGDEKIKPLPEKAAPIVADFIVQSRDSDAEQRPKFRLGQKLGISNLDLPQDLIDLRSRSTTQSATDTTSNVAAPASRFPVDPSLDSSDLMDMSPTAGMLHTPATNKRARELGDELDAKRLRMTPLEGADNDVVPDSVSKVTDSAAAQSQAVQVSEKTHFTFAEVYEDRKRRDEYHKMESSGMMATIKKLQEALAERPTQKDLDAVRQEKAEADAMIHILQEQLRAQEIRINEQDPLIESFQPKLQAAELARNKAVYDLGGVQKQLNEANNTIITRNNEIMALKETIQAKDADIAAARQQLLSHTVPEVRAFEELNAKVRELEESTAKAERKATSAETNFGFVKEQYQKASNEAVRLARENDKLKERMVGLERRASENKVKTAEIMMSSENQQLVARVNELKAINEDLRAQLARRETVEGGERRSQRVMSSGGAGGGSGGAGAAGGGSASGFQSAALAYYPNRY